MAAPAPPAAPLPPPPHPPAAPPHPPPHPPHPPAAPPHPPPHPPGPPAAPAAPPRPRRCCGRLARRLFAAPDVGEQVAVLGYYCAMPTHAALFEAGTRAWLGARYLSEAPPARSAALLADLDGGLDLPSAVCALWHEACEAGTPLKWPEVRRYDRVDGEEGGGGDALLAARRVLTAAWWRVGWGMLARAVDADLEARGGGSEGCCGLLPLLYERALDMRDPACEAIRARSTGALSQAYAVLIAVNELGMGGLEDAVARRPPRWRRGESPYALLGWEGMHPLALEREPVNRHVNAMWREGLYYAQFGLFVMAHSAVAEAGRMSLRELARDFRDAPEDVVPWRCGDPWVVPPPPEAEGDPDATGAFYETGARLVERGMSRVTAAHSVHDA